MINIPFISLEGTDLSGKSTLYKTIWRKLQSQHNFQLLLTDRGYFSVLCYGVFYNRAPKKELEDNFLRWLNKNYVIYLPLDEETIVKRYHERSDDDRTLQEILKAREIYEEYAQKYKGHPNFIVANVPTDDDFYWLDTYIKLRPLDSWAFAAHLIVTGFGEVRGNLKELTNFEFETVEEWKDLEQIESKRTSLVESRGDWAQLEEDSYKYQEARFMRSVETVLCGYRGKKEGLESRKFVFTDDECLSFLHILVRDDNFFVKVQFRSSNSTILYYDLMSVIEMVKQFSHKVQFKPQKVYFSVAIDSLHTFLKEEG